MLHDLASRQHDMWIDDPWACVGTNGASAGALSALAMLQELTNCGFNNEVCPKGEEGRVPEVAGRGSWHSVWGGVHACRWPSRGR